MYLWICIPTHLHTVYLDWLQAVLESNLRCAWRWRCSELRDTLGGGDCVNLEMHLKARIERVGRCTGRAWSSELRDALGGHNRVSLEMHLGAEIKSNSEIHLGAVIERVWRCIWRPQLWHWEMHLEAVIQRDWRWTWRPWSGKIRGVLGHGRYEAVRVWDSLHRLVDSQPWEWDEVTLPLSSRVEGWLVTVERVGWHAGSWSYTQGSTCNCENEWKTDNLWWMLYSVYAVQSVSCTRCMLYSVLTHSHGMER